jgi:hypothetical protein
MEKYDEKIKQNEIKKQEEEARKQEAEARKQKEKKRAAARKQKEKKRIEYNRLYVDTHICHWDGKKYVLADTYADDKEHYCSRKCEYEDKKSRGQNTSLTGKNNV